MAQIAGDYTAYVEATVGNGDQTTGFITTSTSVIMITIKEDGTYRVIINRGPIVKRGTKLDEGKVEIYGKSIAFFPKKVLPVDAVGDKSFTSLGSIVIDPVSDRRYQCKFPAGDIIYVEKIR